MSSSKSAFIVPMVASLLLHPVFCLLSLSLSDAPSIYLPVGLSASIHSLRLSQLTQPVCLSSSLHFSFFRSFLSFPFLSFPFIPFPFLPFPFLLSVFLSFFSFSLSLFLSPVFSPSFCLRLLICSFALSLACGSFYVVSFCVFVFLL